MTNQNDWIPSGIRDAVYKGSPLLSALKQARDKLSVAQGGSPDYWPTNRPGEPDPIEQRIADGWRLSCNAPTIRWGGIPIYIDNGLPYNHIVFGHFRAPDPVPAAENCCPHCGEAAGTKTIPLFTGTAEVCAGCGQ